MCFLFVRQGQAHLSNKLYTDRSNKLSIRAPKHRVLSYTMINHLVRKRNENNERDERNYGRIGFCGLNLQFNNAASSEKLRC